MTWIELRCPGCHRMLGKVAADSRCVIEIVCAKACKVAQRFVIGRST